MRNQSMGMQLNDNLSLSPNVFYSHMYFIFNSQNTTKFENWDFKLLLFNMTQNVYRKLTCYSVKIETSNWINLWAFDFKLGIQTLFPTIRNTNQKTIICKKKMRIQFGRINRGELSYWHECKMQTFVHNSNLCTKHIQKCCGNLCFFVWV